MKKYLDFDLELSKQDENYHVCLVNSPVGRTTSRLFAAPITQGEVKAFFDTLDSVREARDLMRKQPDSDAYSVEEAEKKVRDIGTSLYNALFDDEIALKLKDCERIARGKVDEAGVRIRLRFNDVPELETLPWELMYSESDGRFIGLSKFTPIVRFVESPQDGRSWWQKLAARMRNVPARLRLWWQQEEVESLNILVMVSDPSDYDQLNVEQEWKNLQKSLEDLIEEGVVRAKRMENASIDELRAELRREKYHVFHFIGHGGLDENENGILIFEKPSEEGGRPVGLPVRSQVVGNHLRDEVTLRLALLNSCDGASDSATNQFASMAKTLVRNEVPAVVAMQHRITDKAAIEFSSEFYRALAEKDPISAAVTEARKAVDGSRYKVEWGTPALFMRMADGHLIKVREQKPHIVKAAASGLRRMFSIFGIWGTALSLLLLTILVTVAAFFMWIWLRPCKMDGTQFNLAITRFDNSGTENGRGLRESRRLFNQFEQQLEDSSSVNLEKVCFYSWPTVKSQETAGWMARIFGADSVIWGTATDTGIEPRIFNPIQYRSDFGELGGLTELPYDQQNMKTIDASIDFVRALDQMESQTDVGLNRAAFLLDSALENAGESQEAVRVITLLATRVARKRGNFDAAHNYLCQALQADARIAGKTEKEINAKTCEELAQESSYGRAIISLGSLYFDQAQAIKTKEGWNEEASVLYMKSLTMYEHAEDLDLQPPEAYIREKALTGQGMVLTIQFLSDKSLDEPTKNEVGGQAMAAFTELLAEYESTERKDESDHPYFRDMAATALGYSGLILHKRAAEGLVSVDVNEVCRLYEASLELSEGMFDIIGEEFEKLRGAGFCQ